VKRWGINPLHVYPAVVVLAALGMVALKTVSAAVPGYTFQKIVCETDTDPTGTVYGDGDGGRGWFQINDLNNKGQFAFNAWGAGSERLYFWDGTKVLVIIPTDKQVGGAPITQGNMWTPSGINEAGKVSIVADTPDVSPHSVVVWDSSTLTYTLIANKDSPLAGGGTRTGTGVVLQGRMVTDINNKDEVVWSEGVTPEGSDEANDAVFLYDPVTKEIKTVARKGTSLPDGKTVLNALYPTLNDKTQVVFMASTEDNEDYGVYQWESGNITAIATPGTKVGDITIASAKLPRISDASHVVFVGELVSSGGAVPVTADTGVFLSSGGTITKVVAPGDTMPGGDKWVGLENQRRTIGVNSSGTVVFKGHLEGDKGGLFMWKAGQTSSLILSGETIADAGTVESLNRDQGDMSGYMIAINDPGDVAFSAFVSGQECFFLAKAPPPTAGN
jgi:hypothetical protein